MAQSIIADPYLQDTKTAVITGAATGAIAVFTAESRAQSKAQRQERYSTMLFVK